MAKATIDREWCKGCELCVSVCPKKTLIVSATLNEKGYFPAEMTDEEKCNGCGMCFIVCPDVAIEIE